MDNITKKFRPFVITIVPNYEEIYKELEEINNKFPEDEKKRMDESLKRHEDLKKYFDFGPGEASPKSHKSLPEVIEIYFLTNDILNITESWPSQTALTRTSFATSFNYTPELLPRGFDSKLRLWSRFSYFDLKSSDKNIKYDNNDNIIEFKLNGERFVENKILFSIPRLLLKPYYEEDEFWGSEVFGGDFEKYKKWILQCKKLIEARGIGLDCDGLNFDSPIYRGPDEAVRLSNKWFGGGWWGVKINGI
jgi:hypothetical protein